MRLFNLAVAEIDDELHGTPLGRLLKVHGVLVRAAMIARETRTAPCMNTDSRARLCPDDDSRMSCAVTIEALLRAPPRASATQHVHARALRNVREPSVNDL
jgi:hypothetical protein